MGNFWFKYEFGERKALLKNFILIEQIRVIDVFEMEFVEVLLLNFFGIGKN